MGAVGGVERGDHSTAVGMENLNDNLEVSAGRFLSVKNESICGSGDAQTPTLSSEKTSIR